MRRFLALLALELRFLLRQASFWAAFGPLTLCLVVAAYLGAVRVEDEWGAIGAAQAEEQRIEQLAEDATERFSQPSPLKVDFYRDPTGAYSYMTMFLVRHTFKPPTPLSALAIGQSDVQPSPVRMTFGFSAILTDDYVDIASPRMLKLGGFDIAFVLIYLLPLALIAVSVTRMSAEQDSGILRMITAQPVPLRIVAGAKFGAVGLMFLAWLAVAGSFCLYIAGVLPVAPGWGGALASVAASAALYGFFWIAICGVSVALWRGARSAISCAISIWLAATIIIPAAAASFVELTSAPSSRVQYIDASRKAVDHFYEDGPAVAAQWAAAHPQLWDRPDLASGTEVARLARDAYFRETLLPFRTQFDQRQVAIDNMSSSLAAASPALLLRQVLENAAGTDQQRQITFLRDTDNFGQSVRTFFAPRIIESIRNPPQKCAGCTAQLNFRAYRQVPRFEQAVSYTASAVAAMKANFLLLAFVVAALAMAGVLARRRGINLR